ncbi:antileukoproteinase-like [Bufo gargarizans]|uniref:antileukoproteinase-like n=1 Tax=Bufo gargarizans TaxID=30331 RepID=UPI001CF55729|nr:antileukoproteinase-like [Bufo gargarizans]
MAPVTGSLILLILCCAGALADNHDKPPQPSEKPGRCPLSKQIFCNPPPPYDCNSDKECDGNLKCCRQGCNKSCTAPIIDPIIEKPGTCPSPWFVCPHDDVPFKICTVDSDCTGNRKCCNIKCRQQCIDV